MKRSAAFVFALAGMTLLASSAAASEKPTGGRPRPERPTLASMQSAKGAQQALRQRRLASGPDSFGISCCQILQIPASSFVSVSGATPVNDDVDGYSYVTAFGTTTDDLMATVTLPTGAHLVFMDLYFDDTNVADELQVTLYRLFGGNNGAGGTGAAGFSLVGEVDSFGSGGQDYSVASLDQTVLNDVAYNADAGQYTVYVYFPAADGTLKFKGVDLWWERQLSPAPVTATFPDVPTGDGGFQYVEALVAAGITGGCGGGNYCPDNPVTRRQMAVFISKALGLYWPY